MSMGQSGRDLKEYLQYTLWPHCRILCLPFHQHLPDSELTYNWKLDERLWFSLLATRVRFLHTNLAESPDQLTFSRWTSSFLGRLISWQLPSSPMTNLSLLFIKMSLPSCFCQLSSALALVFFFFFISHHPNWNKGILLSLSFGSITWHMGF